MMNKGISTAADAAAHVSASMEKRAALAIMKSDSVEDYSLFNKVYDIKTR